MEVTNYFNDSELVVLNAQEMEIIEGGGIFSFVAGVVSAVYEAGYSAGAYVAGLLR
jgi:lactobin A/cerein 7B family class IIb bacteriocin